MPTAVFVDTNLSTVTTSQHGKTRMGTEEMGAQLVAACVEKFTDWSVRFLRPNSNDIGKIEAEIKNGPCDALVLFPYTYTKSIADRLADEIKGQVPIIYGGYHAGIGNMPQQVINEGRADFVIKGRGEESLPKLLSAISTGKAKRGVIQFENKNDNNSLYPLDVLPWPTREARLMRKLDDSPLQFPPPETLIKNPQRCVTIAGSIGCDGRCDFCPAWLLSPKSLLRSPQNVIDEMIWLDKHYGPGLVYVIANPLFNANREWVMQLCDLMERHGPFPSLCTLDFLLDREMVRAMKRAGIFMAMMGLEFADTELRAKRGKRCGDPATAFHLCDEEGILTRAYFMTGRLGMTHKDVETEKERLDNFSFRADQLRVSFEVPFPGTLTWSRLKPGDIIADYDDFTTEKIVYRTGINPTEWDGIRQDILNSYHASDRQKEHYENKIKKHPELEKPVSHFLAASDS